MTSLRVAVLSDIHASVDAIDDTYVLVEPPARPFNEQPIQDLLRFVAATRLKADILISPGDLTNRSDNVGRQYAWTKLHELAREMGANHLFAAPGNHDFTTHDPVPNPSAGLQLLDPSFPSGDRTTDSRFWTDGFLIVENELFRILIVNSCVDAPSHPGPAAGPEEMRRYKSALDRGRFPERVQTALESRLAQLEGELLNIAVVHHHPIEHESRSIFRDSYGPMDRGHELLRVLEECVSSGRWFVIHGHKHVPRLISSLGGTANAPLLLGAASIGGKLWHPVVTVTRNQFHIIEFELDQRPDLARLRGSVESFMWCFGDGWKVASRSGAGLPPRCGFGQVINHRVLAQSVHSHIDELGVEYVRWDSLAMSLPAVLYQSPRDFELFERELTAFGYVIERDGNERIRRVAKENAMS